VRNIYLILILIILNGCSLFPKRVEYFQDKVQKVPQVSEDHKEVQKEAADYVSRKTKETVIAAIKEDSSTNVLKPAVEAEVVASSLSGSLGKPYDPWKKDAEELKAKLDRLDAKLDARLEDFREDNDKNAGKKIEGSGAFSMGYFTQFIVLAFVLGLLWVAIKVVGLFNPAVSVGSQVLSGGFRGVTKIVRKGFSEVVAAGEEYKRKIEEEFEDPETKEKILSLFVQSHKEKQSAEVQEVIKKLTNPDVK